MPTRVLYRDAGPGLLCPSPGGLPVPVPSTPISSISGESGVMRGTREAIVPAARAPFSLTIAAWTNLRAFSLTGLPKFTLLFLQDLFIEIKGSLRARIPGKSLCLEARSISHRAAEPVITAKNTDKPGEFLR